MMLMLHRRRYHRLRDGVNRGLVAIIIITIAIIIIVNIITVIVVSILDIPVGVDLRVCRCPHVPQLLRPVRKKTSLSRAPQSIFTQLRSIPTRM